jgi:hypothetical protein
MKVITMTSEKQIKANQANSKKSTGATTNDGKLVIANNALKHGLFAQRLILTDESLDEYAKLIDGLISSLNPAGTLEQLLVEKIAVATWKQLRLTRAESASIELDRRMERDVNIAFVGKAIGKKWGEPDITIDEFKQDTDEDLQHIAWCRKTIAEYVDLKHEVIKSSDLVRLKADAPLIYEHLVDEAENEGYELAAYVNFLNQDDDEGFYEWVLELHKLVRDEVKTSERKVLVQAIGHQVIAKLTAPIGNELMARYQAGIDNELYKAIEALRKQQEWRSKGMVTLEAEVT